MKKSVSWHELPRQSRLARVMYPHLTDPESRNDMANLARGEGKKSPQQGQLDAEKARLEQQSPKSNRRW